MITVASRNMPSSIDEGDEQHHQQDLVARDGDKVGRHCLRNTFKRDHVADHCREHDDEHDHPTSAALTQRVKYLFDRQFLEHEQADADRVGNSESTGLPTA